MVFAFFIAIVLLLMGIFTIRKQSRALRTLRSSSFVPSDERRYVRNLAWRRIVTSVFLLILGGMLAGAYLSGLEHEADIFGRKIDENNQKLPLTEEQKQFARVYYVYWATVLLLLFLVVSLAIVDIWSTRRYAWAQLRLIQKDNRARLERDLAMHRQQVINDRMKNVE